MAALIETNIVVPEICLLCPAGEAFGAAGGRLLLNSVTTRGVLGWGIRNVLLGSG
jgi:hypothetical protein